MKKKLMLLSLPVLLIALMSWQDKQKIPAKTMQNGKKVYETYCAACHQADGNGVPSMHPPLIKTDYVTGDKKRLINIILNGMNEPIKIKDQQYNTQMMPVNYLTDDQIADVLTYIRNSFGNKASMVKASEVKALRPKEEKTAQ